MIQTIKQRPFFRKMLICGCNVLSAINQIIPKNEQTVLFYDSAREFLDDNTEAIYSYMLNKGYGKRYKLVCCVPSQKKLTPQDNYKPIGSFKGVFTYLTAKYVFFSFGDFRIRPSKKQIVVNQWHGTGTKKGGKQINDANYQSERLDNFTYFLASSDTTAPVMAEQFGCSMSKIRIQGSARNDYLFSDKETLSLLGINKGNYKRILLWMPTFRDSSDNRFHEGHVSEETQLPLLYTHSDLVDFNEFLKDNNVMLVIKAHPLSKLKNGELSNIIIIKNNDLRSKGIKLYEFIKDFDALITDYSSVFPDFLLLNRPIGFTMDDYEEYEKTRGFFFDNFKNYMPGHHMLTIDDMKQFTLDVVEGNDNYQNDRLRTTPVFWKYTDGKNCERLLKLVGITK